jgi:hypothetical protein
LVFWESFFPSAGVICIFKATGSSKELWTMREYSGARGGSSPQLTSRRTTVPFKRNSRWMANVWSFPGQLLSGWDCPVLWTWSSVSQLTLQGLTAGRMHLSLWLKVPSVSHCGMMSPSSLLFPCGSVRHSSHC